jgi:hypothetical protein
MPILKGTLQIEGALVVIVLGWSVARARRLRAALRPVPPPVNAQAIIDSGAEVTCVDSSLIQVLGLPLVGTVLANLPAHGGVTASALHDASLTVVHPSGNARSNLVVGNLEVLELSLAPVGYHILLGRDVLAACRFLYNGPGNSFQLAY